MGLALPSKHQGGSPERYSTLAAALDEEQHVLGVPNGCLNALCLEIVFVSG
jgi:hypothetical protein